jgi:hypothetical protein
MPYRLSVARRQGVPPTPQDAATPQKPWAEL